MKKVTMKQEFYNQKKIVKNGKMDGFSKLYYPNGKLGSEATFKADVQVGVQKRLL